MGAPRNVQMQADTVPYKIDNVTHYRTVLEINWMAPNQDDVERLTGFEVSIVKQGTNLNKCYLMNVVKTDKTATTDTLESVSTDENASFLM